MKKLTEKVLNLKYKFIEPYGNKHKKTYIKICNNTIKLHELRTEYCDEYFWYELKNNTDTN